MKKGKKVYFFLLPQQQQSAGNLSKIYIVVNRNSWKQDKNDREKNIFRKKIDWNNRAVHGTKFFEFFPVYLLLSLSFRYLFYWISKMFGMLGIFYIVFSLLLASNVLDSLIFLVFFRPKLFMCLKPIAYGSIKEGMYKCQQKTVWVIIFTPFLWSKSSI